VVAAAEASMVEVEVVVFMAEVEARTAEVEAVASMAVAEEASTPVAEDIAVAAPTGACGPTVAAAGLSVEEATTGAEATVVDQGQAATEPAGARTAGSVPRAA
jgi:hypothetical protein